MYTSIYCLCHETWNWTVSCFQWSFVRCLIGVHLWLISVYWTWFEKADTCLYKVWYFTVHEPSHEFQGILCRSTKQYDIYSTCCLAHLSTWDRRSLVTKNPMVTLTPVQCSSVEIGQPFEGEPFLQHSTSQACVVKRCDRSHSSVKGTWQPTWRLPKGTWNTLRSWETKLSGLMKQRLNSLTWMTSVIFGGNQAPLISWPVPSLQKW